jgi:hypothetical protein
VSSPGIQVTDIHLDRTTYRLLPDQRRATLSTVLVPDHPPDRRGEVVLAVSVGIPIIIIAVLVVVVLLLLLMRRRR